VNASDTTIAICTYTEDRYPLIVEAIKSAERQVGHPAVLVVVDYNEPLRSRLGGDFPHLDVVANTETRGLSGGRNTAMAHCRTAALGFLDDDGVLEEDWTTKLTAAMDGGSIVAAGSRVIPRWETERPRWLVPEFDWVMGCSYRGLPTEASAVRNPFGGSMVLRVADAVRAGGFRSDLGRIGSTPLGCEETDLFLRMRGLDRSLESMYVPDAIMRHFVPDSRCTMRYYMRRCYGEGLSKASISALHPGTAPLGSERHHALVALPRAVARELRSRNLQGAAGVVVGLSSTVAGYVVGRLSPRLRKAARSGSW
jgi:glucosyl-dolichyl phosphate glucuronosyltransferase